jgi:hypothetical protein
MLCVAQPVEAILLSEKESLPFTLGQGECQRLQQW